MNPFVMILSRICAMTFGRISLLSLWMKKVLIFFMIKRARRKYVAATRYFDWKEWENQKRFP